VLGNRRPCGCGGAGCVETLVSRGGLLQSFAAQPGGGHGRDWPALQARLKSHEPPPWLIETLTSMGGVIAGALNVLGLRRVIVTGSLTELPPVVLRVLSDAVVKGAMWARFGKVTCESAPRRRAAGLVAAGIDRIVMPMALRDEGRAEGS